MKKSTRAASRLYQHLKSNIRMCADDMQIYIDSNRFAVDALSMLYLNDLRDNAVTETLYTFIFIGYLFIDFSWQTKRRLAQNTSTFTFHRIRNTYSTHRLLNLLRILIIIMIASVGLGNTILFLY